MDGCTVKLSGHVIFKNYGIKARNITAVNGVWSGSVKVDTSNVSIIGNTDYVHSLIEYYDLQAIAVDGNKIAAYGLYADESINIDTMGSLKEDYSNDTYDSSINITVSDNMWDLKGAAVSGDMTIIAAAIYAKNITIDTIKDFNITVNVAGNKILTSGGLCSGTNYKFLEYGIYAEDTLKLGLFDTTITVANSNNNVDFKDLEDKLGEVIDLLAGAKSAFELSSFTDEETENGKKLAALRKELEALSGAYAIQPKYAYDDGNPLGIYAFGIKAKSLEVSRNFGGFIKGDTTSQEATSLMKKYDALHEQYSS